MTDNFKPMLAASHPKGMPLDEFYNTLRYPVLATPKLDGIRCLISPKTYPPYPALPVTRSLKEIPNREMRIQLSELPVGLDGELVAAGSFQNCQSAVMSETGDWEFKYYVFDVYPCVDLWKAWNEFGEAGYHIPYWFRIQYLESLDLPDFCIKVLPTKIDRGGLPAYTQDCLEKGYEGSIIRTPLSPYKYGRSTFREQWMVKVKQFLDDEATVIGYEEELHNANQAERNMLGYQERSSHRANMVGKGRLGSLRVLHSRFGEFNIGSGFNESDRISLWSQREELRGRYVTFRYQPQGMKDKPRIPIFKGFRDGRDMDVVQKELI